MESMGQPEAAAEKSTMGPCMRGARSAQAGQTMLATKAGLGATGVVIATGTRPGRLTASSASSIVKGVGWGDEPLSATWLPW